MGAKYPESLVLYKGLKGNVVLAFNALSRGWVIQKYVKSVYCSGRRSKQRIQGQRIIFEGKGPKGWNKNILLLYFPY